MLLKSKLILANKQEYLSLDSISYIIVLKVVAGLSLAVRCRFMRTDKNQGTLLTGRAWLNNILEKVDTCTFFPCDIAYTPISSSFSSSSFLSFLTLPLSDIRECELISCSCNLTMLFCTEIRRRLPFRSQSHISVEFFGIEIEKEPYNKIYNFSRFNSAN